MAGLKPLLKDIADAIRAKSGTTAAIPASEFATRVGDFKTFDGNITATATTFSSAVRVSVTGITVSASSLVLTVTVHMNTGGGTGTVSGQTITVTFGS